MSTKDTNPKDAVGTGKAPISTVSAVVIAEVGLAMLEGARKYGRHNYRVSGVRASVYYDAVVNRHLGGWWEGESTDPDSGLSHITKAIAGLVVLRDSMIQGNWIDDRPPPSPAGYFAALNAKAAEIVRKFPDPKEPFLATDTPEEVDRKLGRVPAPRCGMWRGGVQQCVKAEGHHPLDHVFDTPPLELCPNCTHPTAHHVQGGCAVIVGDAAGRDYCPCETPGSGFYPPR